MVLSEESSLVVWMFDVWCARLLVVVAVVLRCVSLKRF